MKKLGGKCYQHNITSSDESESALSSVSNMSFRNVKTCFRQEKSTCEHGRQNLSHGHKGDHTFTKHFMQIKKVTQKGVESVNI